jgi:hypothetical protein
MIIASGFPVPAGGTIFNSDSHLYAGSNQGNGGAVETELPTASSNQFVWYSLRSGFCC